MPPVSVWRGRPESWKALLAAVSNNCTCKPGKPTCPAHSLLIDQRVLDHFAYTDNRRERFIRAEFDPMAEWL